MSGKITVPFGKKIMPTCMFGNLWGYLGLVLMDINDGLVKKILIYLYFNNRHRSYFLHFHNAIG